MACISTMTENESGFSYGSCSGTEELRMILVGSAGAGKSATGNSILGEERFESRASLNSVTLECEKGVCERDGRRLVVVDTLGFYNRNTPREVVQRDVSRCKELCAPGPHAIVLVLQAGRFRQEEAETVEAIQRVLGRRALKHMVVVFTRKEDLGQMSIQEFVEESKPKFKEFIAKIGGRFCAFNNRATGDENTRQVEELIDMIENIKKKKEEEEKQNIGEYLKPFCNRGMAGGAGLGLAFGIAVAVGAGTPFTFMVALMPVGLGVVGGFDYDLFYRN